ncbi:MAG: hypothetical protein ABSF96_08005 [Steroidobacteraceae bacterium]|jgi:hypothetical protein
MKAIRAQCFVAMMSLSLLQIPAARAAPDRVDLHVYVADSCIVADEPYFVAQAPTPANGSEATPKFLPLLGVVVGKVAELWINHEIQGSANKLKGRAARKDTRYALTREMNLYRADLQAAPVLEINSKLGCMTIVAAKMKPEATDCRDAYIPKELTPESVGLAESEWKSSRSDDSVENQLRRANVCVDGKAAAVYEGRFEFSKDGTAYRLKNAGYRINSLLTSQTPGVTRTALYTLKISEPGATDQQQVLSSAWVNLGTVSAGARSAGADKDEPPWLRTPPLSADARRVYEEKTKTHGEIAAEIDTLKRTLNRSQRVLAGLDQRIAAASGELAAGLQQERTRVAVQIQTQSAELDACNTDFEQLPHAPMEFMPVTIEVAVTETESERKAQLALADLVGSNSDIVASAAASVFSKSVDPSALRIEPDDTEHTGELAQARDRYFTALLQTPGAGGAIEPSAPALAIAKGQYNDARRSMGLAPVQ